MNWFVYFLKLSNGHIYVGSTNNVERRLTTHSEGSVKSTKAHLPVERKDVRIYSGKFEPGSTKKKASAEDFREACIVRRDHGEYFQVSKADPTNNMSPPTTNDIGMRIAKPQLEHLRLKIRKHDWFDNRMVWALAAVAIVLAPVEATKASFTAKSNCTVVDSDAITLKTLKADVGSALPRRPNDGWYNGVL